jgi:hypothetical protein
MLVVCLVSFNASAGIIARYSFDVNAADDSGNGNHGGLQYGAVAGVIDAERGLVLDVTAGVDSRVYLIGSNSSSNWLTDALVDKATVMMWAKFDADGGWADTPQLFGKGWSFYMYGTSATSSMFVEGRTASAWLVHGFLKLLAVLIRMMASGIIMQPPLIILRGLTRSLLMVSRRPVHHLQDHWVLPHTLV